MTKIAILGLGAMGARMADRLLAAGHELVVYNRTAQRAGPVVAAGATLAPSPREAVSSAEVVLAMVTDDGASRSVWMGDDGALEGLPRGAIAVEMSTLTPGWVRELARYVTARGGRFLDAPVAGSRPQVEAGSLVVFAGGERETVEEVEPILGCVGRTIHPMGPVGTGTTMKLAVNAFFAAQVAAMAESLAVAERGGLDVGATAELLACLPITSPALAQVGAAIAAGRFAPQFPIELVQKDLRYAVSAGEREDRPLPLIRSTADAYQRAMKAGHGDENIHAVARPYLRKAPRPTAAVAERG